MTIAMPTTAGRFRLKTPDGRIERMKVIDMNNKLWAVQCRWIWPWAMPIAGVEGEWLTEEFLYLKANAPCESHESA